MKPLSLLKIALLGSTMMPGIITSDTAFAGSVGGFGGATEFTQILNNAQLAGIQLKNIQQVANQITQINNQIQQISYALKSYNNMIQNTASLPGQVWGNVTSELNTLRSLVGQGRSLAYNLANVDQVVAARFKDFAAYQASPLNRANYATAYADWSKTNSDTIGAVLKTAGLQEGQFANEQATLQQLENMSMSSNGQQKSLQVANQIAVQQVQQLQKLRQLVMAQMSMQAAFNAKVSAIQDADAGKNQALTAPGSTQRNTGVVY